MSYYYKYNFVSPEPIYALVKEELKSYFDTGAVDDLLFPTYINKCLQKLSRATLPIKEAPLFMEDFEARLPDNFYAAKEVWMCAETELDPQQMAGSFYSQSGTSIVQIAPVTYGGKCKNVVLPETGMCTDPTCATCVPEYTFLECQEPAVYKINQTVARQYRQVFLLRPGNISARRDCTMKYTQGWENRVISPMNGITPSFDIQGNKLVTNFRKGVIHLVFYTDEVDCEGSQLVPDNYRIKEYLEAYLKFKTFENLTNQVNDETYNQLEKKTAYYKQAADEAYILADIEVKKQTIETKINRILKDKNRNNKYERITASRGIGFQRNK